jgi:hypothetical protein
MVVVVMCMSVLLGIAAHVRVIRVMVIVRRHI